MWVSLGDGDGLRGQTVIRITLQELDCQCFNTNMMKIHMKKRASVYLLMKCEQHVHCILIQIYLGH